MSEQNPPPFPPGYANEYIGYVTRNVAISFTVLELLFVSLRFVSQHIAGKRCGVGDFIRIPSLVLCLGLNVSALIGLHLGHVGYHIAVVKATAPYALVPWAQILVATVMLYSAVCALPKIVLLTLYLRIFNEKKYRISCFVVMGFAIALAVADIIVGAVGCIPLAYLWDKTIDGVCIDFPLFFRWGTLPNIIVDLFMILLPLPVIWKLHTSRQVKIGLTATFLTGSMGMITSILRSVAAFEGNSITDGTWISVTLLNWSIIEPGVYLIAACLPCYRPLVSHFMKDRVASRHTENQYSAGNVMNTFIRKKRTKESYMLHSRDEAIGINAISDNNLNRKSRGSDEQELV